MTLSSVDRPFWLSLSARFENVFVFVAALFACLPTTIATTSKATKPV